MIRLHKNNILIGILHEDLTWTDCDKFDKEVLENLTERFQREYSPSLGDPLLFIANSIAHILKCKVDDTRKPSKGSGEIY